MRAPVFDPLADLYGLWTTLLAERYLPIEGLPPVKYECVDGHLVLSPTGHTATSWAAARMAVALREPARQAGAFACLRTNLSFDPQRWIEPDLTVLRELVHDTVWLSPEVVLLPVEIVCLPRRIDRAALCEAAGVPYFLRVEITEHDAHLELLRLDESGQYVLHTKASAGEEFRTELPFPISFDPAVLLEG